MNKKSSALSAFILAVALIMMAAGIIILLTTAHWPPTETGNSGNEAMPDAAASASDLSAVMEGLPESRAAELEQHALSALPSDQYTEAELAAAKEFYSEAVFVGDSLLMGFRTYLFNSEPTGCFADSLVLASSGYSTISANRGISSESIHPIYRGKQHLTWDAIQLFGGKRVIFGFWANEFSQGNIEESAQNLQILADKIQEVNPGIEMYVISPCYRYNGSQSGVYALTNENLTLLAEAQKEFCRTNGAGYIDVSRFLGNEVDGMYREYAQDMYVHVNKDAYDIWSRVLIDYALGRESIIDNGHPVS